MSANDHPEQGLSITADDIKDSLREDMLYTFLGKDGRRSDDIKRLIADMHSGYFVAHDGIPRPTLLIDGGSVNGYGLFEEVARGIANDLGMNLFVNPTRDQALTDNDVIMLAVDIGDGAGKPPIGWLEIRQHTDGKDYTFYNDGGIADQIKGAGFSIIVLKNVNEAEENIDFLLHLIDDRQYKGASFGDHTYIGLLAVNREGKDFLGGMNQIQWDRVRTRVQVHQI